MLSLNCQSTTNNTISSSVSNGGSLQSLQSIDSDSPNLTMSPLSTMGMSPVAMNPCSPMGMSPMGPHHGYATPVTPSSVHTAHPHNGGLSPMNDVKALCYGRSVYDTGILSNQRISICFLLSKYMLLYIYLFFNTRINLTSNS